MAFFTGAVFVVQVSLIIVAKPFYAIFVPPVYLATKIRRLSLARLWRMFLPKQN